jgi:hypothetical protein
MLVLARLGRDQAAAATARSQTPAVPLGSGLPSGLAHSEEVIFGVA